MQILPSENTLVTFPSHSHKETSVIQAIFDFANHPDKKIIIVERTPFHPVDHRWPDQPGDRGEMLVMEQKYEIINSIMVGWDPNNKATYFDSEIPVTRDNDDWLFWVGHVVVCAQEASDMLGKAATLIVDENYQFSLSVAHSICHLTSLSLNKCTKDLWDKPVMQDSLGNPNFDALAIQKSLISPFASADSYRLGKSIRKKGLDVQQFFERLPMIEKAINDQLKIWLQSDLHPTVMPEICNINERRYWKVELPDGAAQIPCGGTHLNNFKNIKGVKVKLMETTDQEFMLTCEVEIK
ncbi:MAG: hypothetical protein WAW86_05565 [Gammaproteobacteria bacterium]